MILNSRRNGNVFASLSKVTIIAEAIWAVTGQGFQNTK